MWERREGKRVCKGGHEGSAPTNALKTALGGHPTGCWDRDIMGDPAHREVVWKDPLIYVEKKIGECPHTVDRYRHSQHTLWGGICLYPMRTPIRV